MTRNLSRRVEAITPVENTKHLKQLQEILGIMLADNQQAWELQPDGSYIKRQPQPGEKELGTHEALMNMATNDTHVV